MQLHSYVANHDQKYIMLCTYSISKPYLCYDMLWSMSKCFMCPNSANYIQIKIQSLKSSQILGTSHKITADRFLFGKLTCLPTFGPISAC